MLSGAMKLRPRVLPFLLAAILLAASTVLPAQEPDTAIAERAARPSPEWLKSGTIYQVFVRAFSPSGDLNGVTARLDDLHVLHADIVWLMPIHPSGQVKKKGSLGSPYSVRDYYAVDPVLGTKDDLHRLVQEAHRRQMKVILDMVANHTAWDSVMMAHPEFYKKDKDGHVTYPHDWTDVAGLDYTNATLRKYMTDVLVYWVKEFDIDGYRCDVAGEVPTSFWEEARVQLEGVKPDIIMLAEASKPELLRTAFDIDYSWPLLSTLNDVVMNGAPATAIHAKVEEQRALFPRGALHMRISDDHDELRATTRYGYPGSLAASALMFTLDGTPLIYNGMEVGDSTQSRDPALFEPQKIFWSALKWHPDDTKFYTTLAALRRAHTALTEGETVWLHNSDEQHVVTFLRRDASEEFLIAVNLCNAPFRGSVEAGAGNWKEVELPGLSTQPVALPFVSLDSFGARIFSRSLP
jgi:cyclomaltodextrinase